MSVIAIIFLIIAIVFFALAVLNVPRVNWLALGLIFVVLAWLIPAIA